MMQMRSRGILVVIAAFAPVTTGLAREHGVAEATIHIGTMDFATGTLSVPTAGSSQAIRGFAPLWNADGTKLIYLSRTSDSDSGRTTLNVESNGATRRVVTDISLGGAMSVTTDPDVVLIEGANGNGESGVLQVNLLTGRSMMLAAGARASFVSGDRTHLYFFRGEGTHHELVELDLSTRRDRTLISYEHAPDIPESAYVSPDRSHVYYRIPDAGAKTPEPQSRIIERDLASGHERNLLSGRLGHLRPSPDGRYAVVRQLDPARKWVAMRLLPLTAAQPVSDLMRAEGNAALFFSFWSRDSRSVVLQMPENGRPTNWWMSLADRRPHTLHVFVSAATVHPNGKTIAFTAIDD
ncbi:MAG: hypothetical protein JWL61_1415 [Gemmatimonadetes bacterium]|nr:hypothetical protein [Gemmatimonadota bacterium]